MSFSISLCKDCTVRHAGCHDDCKAYKEWLLKHEKEKAIYKREKEKSVFERHYIRDAIERNRR